MRSINILAIIVFVISLGSLMVSAQPPGRTDDSQRVGEGRRERRESIPPADDSRNGTDMIETGSYQLRCRGGNGFHFRSIDSRMHPTGAVITTLEMSFSPSAQAAGAGLQPGECALIERAFYLDEVGQVREPVKVRFETPANAQLKQTQSGTTVDRSSTAAEKYPDENSIPRYLQYPDQYWNFRITNSGEGYFIAQSHAVWKSAVSATKPSRSIYSRPL
jgi:hypothetical protein